MKQSDSYRINSTRFNSRAVQKMVRAWVRLAAPQEIPWTPLDRPLTESAVALVSSAGLALKTDRPFDQYLERDNPWWSDPGCRLLPRDTTGADVRLYHMHMNPGLVEQDLNTLMPLQPLKALAARGVIGATAQNHYAYMGYTLQPAALLAQGAPDMIRQMKAEGVNIVVLVPG
jgi:D-proline reductase (dithiol) PrdB